MFSSLSPQPVGGFREETSTELSPGCGRYGAGGVDGWSRADDQGTGLCTTLWTNPLGSLTRLVTDPVGQLGDLVVGCAALAHQLTDLAVGMHDRGVVAPSEQLSDLW